MKWRYFDPRFEFSRNIHSTWWGHIWFAYDLIGNTKPKCVVELGTHYGISFFSMCQAAKDFEIDCNLHAVDTWEGDAQAKAGYEEKDAVFNVLKKEIELNFKDLAIRLHRKTFDEALQEFEDDSIDILHIDGFHSYEAVKHDFETWLPKVKDNGVILFHDICEKKEGFGVHILWDELKKKYKTIEFEHYHGLGVLFKDGDFDDILQLQVIWKHYYKVLSEKKDLETRLGDFSIEEMRHKIESLGNEIADLNEKNNLITSSKFWKLRNFYLKIKNSVIFVLLSPRKFIKKYLKV